MSNPEQISPKPDQIFRAYKLPVEQAGEQTFQAEEMVSNPLAQLEIENRASTSQKQTILWANQVLEEYNSLPKGNARERGAARNLATQTARRLLANPQDIDVAGSVWKSRKTKEEEQAAEWGQKTGSFYDLLKQEVSRDIKKQWRIATPEQFGQLVEVYEDSVLMQDIFYKLPARSQQAYQLLTIQEVSKILGVHPNTLRRWDNNGTFRAAAYLGPRRDRRYERGVVMGMLNKS